MAKTRSSLGGMIIFALVVAAAAGAWFYWNHQKDTGPEYYTTTVSKGEVIQAVTATGTIKPIRDILVSSQVSGYINKIYTDFNGLVKAHQVIATLDPSSYQAQVQSAEADLENSKAASALQTINVKRDLELLTKGLLAQSDYDTAAALAAEAAAQVKLKEATLQVARTNLSYTTIYSPVDGIVISRNVDVGNTVAASLSAPTLFEIASDLSQMQIDASVAEADIGNVMEDQNVVFTVDAYPNQEFHGTVYQVRNAPSTQQSVVIYDVMIKVPNGDLKLKPGMTANVSIIIARHPDVVKIANSALRFRMPEGTVFKPLPNIAPAMPAAGALPAAAPAAPAKKVKMSQEDNRKALRALQEETSWTPQNGPPNPATSAHILQLARERGIELPERMMTLLAKGARPDVAVVRTIYRLPGGNPLAIPEAVQVKVGISDGTATEVLDGIAPGEVVIMGSSLSSAPPPPGASPFAPRH